MPPAIVQPAASGQPVVPTPVPNGTPTPTARGARGGAFEAKTTQAPVAATGSAPKYVAPVAAPVDQSVPQYSVSPTGEGATMTPEASYVQDGKRITTPYSAQATVTTQHGNAPSVQQGGAAQTVERADQIAPGAPQEKKPLVPEGAKVSQEQDNIQLLPEASPADIAKNAYAQNPGLTKEQFNKLNPNSPNGAWEAYVTQQQAAFPSASFIAIAQLSGQPIPQSVKESKEYTDAQVLTTDVNAAIANPDLSVDLGVVPGSEKYSVATATDSSFPAKYQESVRQKAAMTIINGTDSKRPDEKGGVLDTTAKMYDGRKIDFSSERFIEELMKDKKYIAENLEELNKASADTRSFLAPYQKEFADAHADSLQKKADLDNAQKLAYEELAGTGASQSSVDALAGFRSMKLEIAYQTALIKEGNAQAIYLGQKELMQQDWDRRLKSTDTYEKLANIDATIFSTVSQRQYQQDQLKIERQKLEQETDKFAPGETVIRKKTGEVVAGQSANIGNVDFGGGESISGNDIATRLAKDFNEASLNKQKLATAGNDQKQQLGALYGMATTKEKDPDQIVEGSAQALKKIQTAIAAIKKNPGYFGIGAKYQDLISAINSQDPQYAELKAAVQAVQAGITTGLFGSRDSSSQIGMTDQMANALKSPNAETAIKIMAQVTGQKYREAIGQLTKQGLSASQADVLLKHHISSL